jgi:hypothetical protein
VAYRLRAHESVAKGLKRVVSNELQLAIDQLDRAQPSDESIHEARKSIKKARAVLQLADGAFDAESAITQLRRAAHLLSPLRDAEAMIEMAGALCARAGRSLPAETCSALSETLRHRKAGVSRVARRGHSVRKAVRSLQRVQRSAAVWKWKQVRSSTLISQIRRSYKKARRRMRGLSAGSPPDTFHAWRKGIKKLWYAARLLEHRVSVRRQMTDLGHLESWLGDDHNLVVLQPQITNGRRLLGAQRRAARVEQIVNRRQHDLRRKALTVGTRVFNDSPKKFAKRFQQL